MADVAHTLESSQAQPPALTLSPEIEQRKAAALELLGTVQTRLGRELTYAEWRALNPLGAWSAGELSPIEAEIMVRLVPHGSNRVLFPPDQVASGPEQALQQLRQRIEPQPGLWFKNWVGLAFPLAIAAGLAYQLVSNHLLWGLGCVLCAGCAALGAWKMIRERLAAEQLVISKLPNSDILARLGENEVVLDSIQRHTPAPFSWIFLGWPDNSLSDRVRLVTQNLDWYLRPATTLLRWEWLKFGSVALVVLFTAGWYLGNVQGILPPASNLFMLAGLYLSAIKWIKQDNPREFFADALITLMHSRQAERIREGQSAASLPLPDAQPASGTEQAVSAT